MSFEIVAMGDAYLLGQVMEGVALFVGGDDFNSLIRLGLVGGIILTMLKSVITSKIDMSSIFAGILLTMVMFGPKTTVWIVDPYGDLPIMYCSDSTVSSSGPSGGAISQPWCNKGAGGVLKVDNVPIGIAAPYAVVSSVGVGLAGKMSQVFGAPKMYEKSDGYINALRVLAKMRNFDGNQADLADSAEGTSTKQTLVWYWKKCTEPFIAQGRLNQNAIMNSDNPIQAMFVDMETLDTPMFVDGYPSQVSCRVAGTWLQQNISEGSEFFNKLKGALPKSSTDASFEALVDATTDLNIGAAEGAAKMMMSAYVKSAVDCAMRGDAASDCQMMTQAKEQRRTQWAAEQTLFRQMMRPLMSFVELFIVGASPLVAFLIASGLGVPLASKYFGMLAWVSLWPSTMAICNIYLYSAVQRVLAEKAIPAANQAAISLSSIAGLESVADTAADWIATGGMLASSVPALTLMLIYGSSQTATHLAGRLQAGDSIDEKMSAPSIRSPAAIVQDQAMREHNLNSGVSRKTGAGTGQITGAQTASQIMTSATSEKNAATMASSSARTALIGASAKIDAARSKASGTRTSGSATFDMNAQTNREMGSDYADAIGLKGTEKEAFVSSAAATIGTPDFLGITAKVTSNDAKTMEKAKNTDQQFKKTNAQKMASSAALGEKYGVESVSNYENKTGSSESIDASVKNQYDETKSRQQSAEKNFQDAKAYQSNGGFAGSIDDVGIALMAKGVGAQTKLNDAHAANQGNQKYAAGYGAKHKEMMSKTSNNQEASHAAAVMQGLIGSGQAAAFDTLYSQLSGRAPVLTGGHDSNMNVSGDAANTQPDQVNSTLLGTATKFADQKNAPVSLPGAQGQTPIAAATATEAATNAAKGKPTRKVNGAGGGARGGQGGGGGGNGGGGGGGARGGQVGNGGPLNATQLRNVLGNLVNKTGTPEAKEAMAAVSKVNVITKGVPETINSGAGRIRAADAKLTNEERAAGMKAVPEMAANLLNAGGDAAKDAGNWARNNPEEAGEILAEAALFVIPAGAAIKGARAAATALKPIAGGISKQAGEKALALAEQKFGKHGANFLKQTIKQVTGAEKAPSNSLMIGSR